MNAFRNTCLLAALGVALSVGGCFGGGDDDAPPQASTTEVPDSAGASISAFFAFLLALGSDETSLPLTFGDGFAVPPDDTSPPEPLPS